MRGDGVGPYYCNTYCNQVLLILSEICCLFLLRRDGERFDAKYLQRIAAPFRSGA